MADHQIRLRGGWECSDPAGGSAETGRLTLPAPLSAIRGRRLHLTRRFGRPPASALEPGDSIVLRLESVPGLVAVVLNGQPLTGSFGVGVVAEFPMSDLAERNGLELLVEPTEDAAAKPEETWGDISLIIRSR